jgi:hypothetical protein
MEGQVQSSQLCRPEARICLKAVDPIPSWLSAILQGGFGVEASVSLSVNDLLCRELGLDPQYVRERVTTVFVDGQCVDDLKESVLGNGSTLALSSSMPGLAGAAVRRQSPFGVLRGPVTYHRQQASKNQKEGMIQVKLFNVLIRELGPVFLTRGIVLGKEDLLRLVQECDTSRITVLLETLQP